MLPCIRPTLHLNNCWSPGRPDLQGSGTSHLAALATWAPAGAVEGLELLAGPASSNAAVKAYALRCIDNTDPKDVSTQAGHIPRHAAAV